MSSSRAETLTTSLPQSTLAATGQTLPARLHINRRPQLPEEHCQMAISQCHHAPWTELVRCRPL